MLSVVAFVLNDGLSADPLFDWIWKKTRTSMLFLRLGILLELDEFCHRRMQVGCLRGRAYGRRERKFDVKGEE